MWNFARRCRGIVLIALAALALIAGVPHVSAEETIVDTGTLYLGEPKNCDSPVGICSRSRLTGSMKRYTFTAQTAGPAEDDPNSVVIKGNSVIKFRSGGRLFSDDTVRINQATGDVVHTWIITGGTGRYAKATGFMAAGGSLANLGTGGPYSATISVPDE